MNTGSSQHFPLKRLGGTTFRALQVLIIILAQLAAAFQGPLPVSAAAPAQTDSPVLLTDKADYSPEEVVRITGSGFQPGVEYALPVLRPDGTIVLFDMTTHVATPGWGSAVADDAGALVYDYQLDGVIGVYEVRAFAAPWSGDWNEQPAASVTFTDAIPANSELFQWETKSSGDWIKGELGTNNSNYQEGETVPFMLATGPLYFWNNPYTYSICRDYTNNGKFGYLSLMSYNTSRNPRVPGSIDSTKGPISGINMTINSVTEVGGQGNCNAGQRETIVSFNVSGILQYVHILWGGHLASPLDEGVGYGNSAGFYPGASLQMRLKSPDKTVSIKTNAIKQLASIQACKVVDSGSAAPDQWGFNIDPNPSNVTLPLKPASGESCVQFSGLPSGSYQVAEAGGPTGYAYASGSGTNCAFSGGIATCSVTIGNPATNATATFHNKQQTGTLTVKKVLQPANDPGKFNLLINGEVKAADVGDGGTTGAVTLPIGTYTVSETAGTGTDLGYYVTTIGGDCAADGKVTIGANENKTCTITNTRMGTIIVEKIAHPADTKVKFEFNPSWSDTNFFLYAGQKFTSVPLAPGSYAVEEVNLPADWQLLGSACDDGSALTAIHLDPGETVTCQFDNWIIPNPKLQLTKSVTESTYTAVGNVLHYSYVVKNTGNVDINGPFTIFDDKAADETCPATPVSLDPGDTITCTATYTVTQDDLDAGTVTNTAYATGMYDNQTVASNEDSKTVDATQTAKLGLEKSASPTTYDQAGQVITYTYALVNTGNVTLSAPYTVTDDKIASVTCPTTPATLVPQGAVHCTGTYTITQADLDAGDVINTATATAMFGSKTETSNEARTKITAEQKPALTIDKTAAPTSFSAPGAVISYSYLVTNSGNITLKNVTVVDDKLTVTCPQEAASMAPGDTVTCTAAYTTSQADLDAGKITNVAYAKSGTVESLTDTVTVIGVQTPALTIDKTAQETTYAAVGDPIHYSYLVTNTGNITLKNVTVVDNKVTVTCPAAAASMAPGDTVTCMATYTITQADLNAGKVTNVAYAQSGNNKSPNDTVTVNGQQNPALALTKAADTAVYDHVGQVVTYTYVLKNTGNVTLNAPFAVSDDKVAAVTCKAPTALLAPNQTVTCTGTYTITQADIDAGKLTNLATATARFGGNTITSNQATVTINAIWKPAIAISKTPDLQKIQYKTSATFTITVTNTGNIGLTNVRVTDPLALGCEQTFASLAPSASQTYACSVAYVTKDFTNTATVTATPPTGPDVTASDTAAVQVLPMINVEMCPTPSSALFLGGKVTYCVVVRNLTTNPFTLTSLVDNTFGNVDKDAPLPHQWVSSTCDVPRMMAGKAQYVCSFVAIAKGPVTVYKGGRLTNIITATAEDANQNTATDLDSAAVRLYWRGRTPAQWTAAATWPAVNIVNFKGQTIAVTRTTLVTKVFNVPSGYLSSCAAGCILDLNNDGKADTLADALAYVPGSDSKTILRLLLRAGTAGILNKAQYGAAYPAYSSVSSLIAAVNKALATKSNTTMLNLSRQLDWWNKGTP